MHTRFLSSQRASKITRDAANYVRTNWEGMHGPTMWRWGTLPLRSRSYNPTRTKVRLPDRQHILTAPFLNDGRFACVPKLSYSTTPLSSHPSFFPQMKLGRILAIQNSNTSFAGVRLASRGRFVWCDVSSCFTSLLPKGRRSEGRETHAAFRKMHNITSKPT